MWVCLVFLQSVPFCLFVGGVFALNFVFQSFANLCHDFFLLLLDVRVLKLYIFIIICVLG